MSTSGWRHWLKRGSTRTKTTGGRPADRVSQARSLLGRFRDQNQGAGS